MPATNIRYGDQIPIILTIHTSYLSRAPRAVPVEKKSVMWRNLSTWQIVRWRNSPHDRLSCGKILHMRSLKKSEMWRNNVYNLWCFVAFYNILLQNQFGTIYTLLRRDKISKQFCPWRKNHKYEVCEYTFKRRLCSYLPLFQIIFNLTHFIFDLH